MFSLIFSFRKQCGRKPSPEPRDRARFHYHPQLDILEARFAPSTTQGLHVVPSPTINSSALNATAVISSSDMWAVGSFAPPGSGLPQPLAEHFNGTTWNAVPMAALPPGITANSMA
ncbi:MAG TPA: hypothetical protein VKU02_02090 [Gemmataceae bacterium]|nr:hypothetical protein [Gemmataceae bacterium]